MDVDRDSASGGLFSFSSDGDVGERTGPSVATAKELHSEGEFMSSEAGRGVSAVRGRSSWFPSGSGLLSEPSPAVARTRVSSHALQRRSGAVESIQQSLATLSEVVSDPPPPSSPFTRPQAGPAHSLLQGSFLSPLSVKAAPTDRTQLDTPQASLTLMNETGRTIDMLVGPTPQHDRTFMPSFLDKSAHTSYLDETTSRDTIEDLTKMTGRELVIAFHKSLSVHPNPANVLDLAHSLAECCETQLDRLTEASKATKSPISSEMQTELRLEQATWQLVHVLYGDRVETAGVEEEKEEEEDEMELLASGSSDKEVMDEFFLKDSTIRQAQLVVDWLEQYALAFLDSYPIKVHYFADSVSWENTLHDIQQGIGAGRVIYEMDPDAPTRQGLHLSELDRKDEESLDKHIFACIRAGQLEQAQELCLKCGQPWKAEVLEGWRLHHDPNFGKEMSELEGDRCGNLNRDLWKACCWDLVNEPSYSVFNKAVYSALCGNLKHLLPACQSWFDYVWAYFKVMVDVLAEQKLRSCPCPIDRPLEDLPTDYWNAILFPELIFKEIESAQSPLIRKQCDSCFHVVQKFIIINDPEGLVEVMYDWLQDNPNIQQLRFMSHIVLFVHKLGAPVDDDKCGEIIESYVKALVKCNYSAQVALYTARLPPDLQVACYADLLKGVRDTNEQRTCLELGKEAGLDIAVITKAVVENIRASGMEESFDSTSLELGKEVEITKLDWLKIEVMNWLMFEETQRAEAIRQGNALIRAFLALRKYQAAKEVFQRIPPDSVEVVTRTCRSKTGNDQLPADLENDIKEYHCLQAYLDANDAFSEWFQHFHHKKPERPQQPSKEGFTEQVAFEHGLRQYQSDEARWTMQLDALTQDAETKLFNVLLFVRGGWLVDLPHYQPSLVDEGRSRQMSLLRQLCLPRVCFLLHSLLHSTQQYQKCLQLADVVSSENDHLYKEFRQDELRKLLSLFHKSTLAMLDDQQLDELGYDIA